MSTTTEVRITYRRWIILIPILMIIVGGIVLILFGPTLPAIGIIAGGIVFVGILTLGALFAGIIGIEMAGRKLSDQHQRRTTLRERLGLKEDTDEEEQRRED